MKDMSGLSADSWNKPCASLQVNSILLAASAEQKAVCSSVSESSRTATSLLNERVHQGNLSTPCPERRSGIGNLQKYDLKITFHVSSRVDIVWNVHLPHQQLDTRRDVYDCLDMKRKFVSSIKILLPKHVTLHKMSIILHFSHTSTLL